MHIKLTLDSTSHKIVLPCRLLEENRVAHDGNGPHPHDRMKVMVSDVAMWVQRCDLCGEGGELFDWEDFYKTCPTCGKKGTPGCEGCDPYIFILDPTYDY